MKDKIKALTNCFLKVASKLTTTCVSAASKVRHRAKYIFPNMLVEIAAIIAIFSIICFSSGVMQTATHFQANEALNYGNKDETPTKPSTIIQTDFEVNGESEPPKTQIVEYQTSQMCFIGDSRTVHMEGAVLTDAHFIAKSSMGLDWFNDTASVKFASIADKVEICVVALGINDIRNVDAYIERLNKFAEEYPNKIMIYANLGPVNESLYTGIPNSSLEKFNNKMKDGLSDKWQIIDQYTYLAAEGFNSDDGLHYSFQDSAKIFAWMVDSIKTQEIAVKS